ERHAAAGRGLARQLLRGDAEGADAVAEAFTRAISAIQRAGGPTDAFGPYLRTAVRNAAPGRGRGAMRQGGTEDLERADPGEDVGPYPLSAVRNAAHDRGRGEQRQVVTEDMESVAPGESFVDPALEGLERSLLARAFLSLPERWQAVLWHTEIEGAGPAEVGP